MKTWDIREPTVSLPYSGLGSLLTVNGDKTDADADAVTGSKPAIPRPCDAQRSATAVTGLLRKVVWPVSSFSKVCCAADECYV